MKKKPNKIDIEELSERAASGEEVAHHFGNPVRREAVNKVQRVNVDFPQPMLDRLDTLVAELGTGRQAVIKMAVLALMDRHDIATKR